MAKFFKEWLSLSVDRGKKIDLDYNHEVAS